ncbi:MAG: hypothetical protein CML07_01265 [Psychrobacter sp.]|nr:hypothetical protein [Psychrobacter sp.]
MKAVKAGDYCLLYNYTEGKDHPIYGIWKAVIDGKKNIDKNAWWGMYPYQVRVKLYSKECQCVPRHSIENLVADDEGRVVNFITGYRAKELLQYYSIR